MTIRGYSLKDKRNTAIKTNLKMSKYQLPNGNTVSIICGKNKKMNIVCTIVSNEKLKPCKNGKPRTKKGARCTR